MSRTPERKRAAPCGAARSLQRPACYLLVELPDVLPLPIEPELEPVLGVVVLGDVVLGEVVDEPLEEPLMPEPVLVPPLELELEPLLKCASHSVREIWPSLFVSTDEKLGCELLPELVLGDVVLDELPPAAPVDDLLDDESVADGEADDGLDDEEEESAAAAASERAKSAAAVVTVTVLIMGGPLWVEKAPLSTQASCRDRPAGR